MLRRAAEQAQTPEEAVEAAFAVPSGPTSISPVQVRSEVSELLLLVRAESPQRVLEIGTANGGTLYLLAWASDGNAHVVSLDVRGYDPLRVRMYAGFGRGTQRLDVLRADSQLETTRATVERLFGNQPLDVLFIDGDHSYDGVRSDFERYAPLVRPGGLIALHDIVEGPPGTSGDVPRFWREVRASLREPRELVESWEQGGYGIGVGRKST